MVKRSRKTASAKALKNLEKAVKNGRGKVLLTSAEPKPFQFDYRPLRKLRDFRQGTKRAKIISMMQRPQGASLGEIQKVTEWDRKTAYEGIRLTHTYTGFGLRTDEKGRFHVFTR